MTTATITKQRFKHWTKEEIAILCKHYTSDVYSKQKLLKLLPGRTWQSIFSKANALGLRLTRKAYCISHKRPVDWRKVKKTCATCDREYYVKRSQASFSKYCSRKCMALNKERRCRYSKMLRKIHIDKALLERLYLREKKSMDEMAELLNVSRASVRRRLIEQGIPIRTLSEAFSLRRHTEEEKRKIGLASKLHWMNPEYREKVIKHVKLSAKRAKRHLLVCQYCGRFFVVPYWHLNQAKFCSRSCQVSYNLKMRWRNPDYRQKMINSISGEKNVNWKGGYEPYYGPDWYEQRRRCLFRDNFVCKRCSSTSKLVVHHIIPYRKSKSNSLENLITLCRSCHTKMEAQHAVVNRRS